MLLSIFYQNVRGLRTKTKEFYSNLLNNNYDIICLTETWLLPGIFNEELFDNRYDVYRTDRDYKRFNLSMGGGTLIAVRREICVDLRNISQVPDINDANITIVSINLGTGAAQNQLLFCAAIFLKILISQILNLNFSNTSRICA